MIRCSVGCGVLTSGMVLICLVESENTSLPRCSTSQMCQFDGSLKNIYHLMCVPRVEIFCNIQESLIENKKQSVLFHPSRSFCVRRELMSLRASLGRQKLLISSSRRARAFLSTRAKLSRSKKGTKGPRVSRVVPSISPSA